MAQKFDFIVHNQAAWDKQALEQKPWSQPVSSELIAAAKQGEWEVHITPQPLPKSWLGDVTNKNILCLASAGGQQGPVLAAAGAVVTVFDLSEGQLQQDQMVAAREQLNLKTVQGDMRDLSVFQDEQFDLIVHPISNLYVADVNTVWKECYKVLKPQGVLLASFYNPVVFVGDRNPEYAEQGYIRPQYRLPYSDLAHLPQEVLERKIQAGEAVVFGHSLSDLIGGQLAAGFLLDGFYEDDAPQPRFLIDHYMPTFLATRAIKPEKA